MDSPLLFVLDESRGVEASVLAFGDMQVSKLHV